MTGLILFGDLCFGREVEQQSHKVIVPRHPPKPHLCNSRLA
jgi:hypothetical protein